MPGGKERGYENGIPQPLYLHFLPLGAHIWMTACGLNHASSRFSSPLAPKPLREPPARYAASSSGGGPWSVPAPSARNA
jgi:hypothetical protein